MLTLNALLGEKEILIPIQCEYYALEGLSQLLKNINLIQAHLNPELRLSTILLTMYDGRTNLSHEVAAEVREHFRSEEHTSELQSRGHLVCRLLLEKKNIDTHSQNKTTDS